MSDHTGIQQQLLRLDEVIAITGKSRTGIYEDTTFPRPVKIGPRASAWVACEVQAWIDSRIAERDRGAA